MPKVEVKLDGLLNLAQFLKVLATGKSRVQVGVFGGKTGRNDEKGGVTNAEIGFIHEMGSLTKNIPKRSFLEMPLKTHSQELIKKMAADLVQLTKTGNAAMFLKRLGIAAENLVQEAFETSGWGTWAPNTYRSIIRKASGNIFKRRQQAAEVMFEGAGHTKPLIDSGQLRRSISSRVVE